MKNRPPAPIPPPPREYKETLAGLVETKESKENRLKWRDSIKPKDEFKKLIPFLDGSDKWTAEERGNYFAFFCHGWYGRTGEASYQGSNT
ncbi:hypothetical protein [Endozoicomonas ascidiicola]|uniref:hypothetical protein n=1 Tax=Endozoicomonas ascidiicola TaxID=1698521 RepID=UPI000835218A|nr:hypothetical protein [Endozoicomonas ascidiicola]